MEEIGDVGVREKPSSILTPTLEGNTPGSPLFDYFRDKLPTDLKPDIYGRGLSCLGYARLITEELGGRKGAKILWFENEGEDGLSHAFVVPRDADPTELAYNNTEPMDRDNPHPLTVEEVLRHGSDITDLVYELSWEEM